MTTPQWMIKARELREAVPPHWNQVGDEVTIYKRMNWVRVYGLLSYQSASKIASFIANSPVNQARPEKALEIALGALNFIVNPTHKEPDEYTKSGCFQHKSFEALTEINKLGDE